MCGGVFSEHEVRLKAVDPEEDQILCPNRGSARLEPYAFDLDAPVAGQLEEEKPGAA